MSRRAESKSGIASARVHRRSTHGDAVAMMVVWGKGGVKWDVLYMTRVAQELLHDNLHPLAQAHFMPGITAIPFTENNCLEIRFNGTEVDSVNAQPFLQMQFKPYIHFSSSHSTRFSPDERIQNTLQCNLELRIPTRTTPCNLNATIPVFFPRTEAIKLMIDFGALRTDFGALRTLFL